MAIYMTYSVSPVANVIYKISSRSGVWRNASTWVKNSFKKPNAIVNAFCFFDRPASPASSIAVSNSLCQDILA